MKVKQDQAVLFIYIEVTEVLGFVQHKIEEGREGKLNDSATMFRDELCDLTCVKRRSLNENVTGSLNYKRTET